MPFPFLWMRNCVLLSVIGSSMVLGHRHQNVFQYLDKNGSYVAVLIQRGKEEKTKPAISQDFS